MSIEKRKNKYLVRVYKMGSKSFDKLKDAQKHERDLLNFKNNVPNSTVSNKVLFGEVAQRFLNHVKLNKKYNTWKNYESKVRVWINPIMGSFQIGNITPVTIGTFQAKLKDRKIGDSSYYLSNVVLAEIMSFAFNEKYILINPMPEIESRKRESDPLSSNDYWTKEETQRFLKEASKSEYYLAYVLILNTGLRFNEFACLQSDSFDLKANTLNVFRQIGEKKELGADYYINTTKGNSRRSIPLNKISQEIARNLIEKNKDNLFLFYTEKTKVKKIALKNGNRTNIESYKLITNRTFAHVMERICRDANVKYIGPHGLRDTFSANFLMNGGNIFVLSKLLGHKSVNTTISYYGHLSSEFMASTINIVNFGESE